MKHMIRVSNQEKIRLSYDTAMCWLIKVMVKFQISSLEMKSYGVTIQAKATKQYFPVVLFIMLYNFGPVIKFNFVRYHNSVAPFFWHYFMHFLVHYFHKMNLGIFLMSFMTHWQF